MQRPEAHQTGIGMDGRGGGNAVLAAIKHEDSVEDDCRQIMLLRNPRFQIMDKAWRC